MPLIIDVPDYDAWLAGDLPPLDPLRPFPAERMMAYEVSTKINKAGYDQPDILEPAPETGARRAAAPLVAEKSRSTRAAPGARPSDRRTARPCPPAGQGNCRPRASRRRSRHRGRRRSGCRWRRAGRRKDRDEAARRWSAGHAYGHRHGGSG